MCPPVRAHCRHLVNTIERSVCGGDAALCQITLTILVKFWGHSDIFGMGEASRHIKFGLKIDVDEY